MSVAQRPPLPGMTKGLEPTEDPQRYTDLGRAPPSPPGPCASHGRDHVVSAACRDCIPIRPLSWATLPNSVRWCAGHGCIKLGGVQRVSDGLIDRSGRETRYGHTHRQWVSKSRNPRTPRNGMGIQVVFAVSARRHGIARRLGGPPAGADTPSRAGIRHLPQRGLRQGRPRHRVRRQTRCKHLARPVNTVPDRPLTTVS